MFSWSSALISSCAKKLWAHDKFLFLITEHTSALARAPLLFVFLYVHKSPYPVFWLFSSRDFKVLLQIRTCWQLFSHTLIHWYLAWLLKLTKEGTNYKAKWHFPQQVVIFFLSDYDVGFHWPPLSPLALPQAVFKCCGTITVFWTVSGPAA